MTEIVECVVIGAGVVGLAVARALARRGREGAGDGEGATMRRQIARPPTPATLIGALRAATAPSWRFDMARTR